MPDHDDAQDYTANGPSAFGFRTGGANIAVGAELTGKDTGVHGTGQKIGVLGEGSDAGVLGKGKNKPGGGFGGISGVGVQGESSWNDGVVGISDGDQKSGVYGFNKRTGGATAYGVFGRCNSDNGAGVGAQNEAGDGIVGQSGAKSKSGVFGFNLREGGPAYGVAGTVASADGGGILGFTDKGTGVIGSSRDGAGIKGSSTGSRGARFESRQAAQVQLIPHPPAFELPREGQNGDLIALSEVRTIDLGDPGLVTELWFCTKGSTPGKPATWGRVHFDKFQ